MAYDIFISYRRETGRDDARLLQQALRARGYDVFFDYDSLLDGKFNEKILNAIDEAPVFILMLTTEALDQCANEGDWVRKEIELALAKGHCIIPVAPSNQQWNFPKNLPESLQEIPNVQVSEINKASLFDESIEKIIKNRFPEEMQRKHRVTDFISTVAEASPVFVGREKELERLHELLAAGKFPVVTGAGGTGKSELVFQYAAAFRTEYPGGLFQIDMETAKGWDDAFEDMLSMRGQGVDVRAVLGLGRDKNSHGDGEKDVPGALCRRARETGPILLVLDNVESVKAFLSERVLVKLGLDREIRILATARMADYGFGNTDRGIEVRLDDLPLGAAVELLVNDAPGESDANRAVAERIAKLLGCRALYLRAIPELVKDEYSPFAGSYAELEKALCTSLTETVENGMIAVEDERTPSVLWALTRQSLCNRGGEAWVKLAQVASFFSPDGFRLQVLRYLWGELVKPDANSDHAFYQALNILRRHGVLAGPISGGARDRRLPDDGAILQMHRLTRSAVIQDARQEFPNIESAIGNTLARGARGKAVAFRDWVDLAENLEIVRCLPAQKWISEFESVWIHSLQVCILLKNPKFQEYCDWDGLPMRDWGELLRTHPEYAIHCPWESLNGWAWMRILSEQPQFAVHCQWERLDDYHWERLLAVQPQFAEYCPWEKLTGRTLARIFRKHPSFVERCPCAGEKLSEQDWDLLLLPRWPRGITTELCLKRFLSVVSYFEEHYPQVLEAHLWHKLTSQEWTRILSRYPQFSEKCVWDKLENSDWELLLEKRPEFAVRRARMKIPKTGEGAMEENGKTGCALSE